MDLRDKEEHVSQLDQAGGEIYFNIKPINFKKPKIKKNNTFNEED